MTHRTRGQVAGILFLAVALTCCAVVAGPLEDAREAFKSRDYTTPLRLYRPLAEHGDIYAQASPGAERDQGRA